MDKQSLLLRYWPRESGRPSSARRSGQPALQLGWRTQRCLHHPPRQRCWSLALWSLCAATPSSAPCQTEGQGQGEGQHPEQWRNEQWEIKRYIYVWPKQKPQKHKITDTQRLFQTTAAFYCLWCSVYLEVSASKITFKWLISSSTTHTIMNPLNSHIIIVSLIRWCGLHW